MGHLYAARGRGRSIFFQQFQNTQNVLFQQLLPVFWQAGVKPQRFQAAHGAITRGWRRGAEHELVQREAGGVGDAYQRVGAGLAAGVEGLGELALGHAAFALKTPQRFR